MKKEIFILAFLFLVAPLSSQVIYVNKDAQGLNDGSSWNNAYTELYDAVEAAEYGNNIWVAAGTYSTELVLPVDLYLQRSIKLKPGVKLFGGFLGTESLFQERDWDSNETIITGYNGLYEDSNVFYCEGTDSLTTLDGFTIRDGTSAINPAIFSCDEFENQFRCVGGGIYLYSGDPDFPTQLQIRNCKFTNNYAIDGGAIAAYFKDGSGGLIIEKCIFEKDTSESVGASIAILTGVNDQKIFRINDCNFQENYSYHGAAAIFLNNINPNLDFEIHNCRFTNNKTRNSSAAISLQSYSETKKILIENCLFQGNQTELGPLVSGTGGALLGANFRLVNCAFIENKANWGGAAQIFDSEIIGCFFHKNQAEREGGAIRGADLKLTNCTIIENFAVERGGFLRSMANTSTRDTIINCIFKNNKSEQGGDFIDGVFPATIYMANSAVDAADCDELLAMSTPPSDFLTCGPGMYFNIDPMFHDESNGDFRLKACSPFIDVGNDLWPIQADLNLDLSGNERVQNDHVDLGAWETTKIDYQASIMDISCFGLQNGSISVDPLGGFEPYSFTWANGSMDSILTNLGPGQFGFTITDIDDCELASSVNIEEPDPIEFTIIKIDNTSNTMPNGSASIDSIMGGVQPFSYEWNTGSEEMQINELAEGVYTLTVTDNNGCSSTQEVYIDFITKTDQLESTDYLIELYPNPANQSFYIEVPKSKRLAELRLYSASGGMVLEKDAITGGQGIQVATRDIPVGLYVLQAIFEDGIGQSILVSIKH
ncbi:MAG: T9SS type A sorting domain-containing protein [Saprospiraceae bacterium]